MNLWSLDDLKKALRAQEEIKDWILILDSIRRCERYFLLDSGILAVDQERESSQETVSVRVFVRKGDATDRQGEVLKRLTRSQPLYPQIRVAVEAALQTDHAVWDLRPHGAAEAPELQSYDPSIVADIYGALESLTQRIHAAVKLPQVAQFNSAELFLSVHNREYQASNGFQYRLTQTRVYTEAAFSASEGERSDEYLEARWSVFASDMQVESLFQTAAQNAKWMLQVSKPPTGKLAVAVNAEVLSTLLNGYLVQLSAANRYHDLPHLKVDDEFVPGAVGDSLTLGLDPAQPGGADTVAFSSDGTRQVRQTLVESNRVRKHCVDQQYGQYLGEAPTVTRGTLFVEAGLGSTKELLATEPLVLQILQFSGLFVDENSGTFSSEIRLALLHDKKNGRVIPIKGGSVSGSMSENFKKLRLSSERVHHVHFETGVASGTGYFGPAWALLSEVSVTG
jgi:predicted Zn-dependent protease